jgi:hypothetical protein
LLRSHRQAAQLLSGRVDGALGSRPNTPDPERERDVDSRFGAGMSWSILEEEETRAIQLYEQALTEDLLNPGIRSLIETALLPEVRERLVGLAQLGESSPALAVN